jgi:hypothetical protein
MDHGQVHPSLLKRKEKKKDDGDGLTSLTYVAHSMS